MFGRHRSSSFLSAILTSKHEYSRNSTRHSITTPLSISLLLATGAIGTYEIFKQCQLNALTDKKSNQIDQNDLSNSKSNSDQHQKENMRYSKQFNFIADVVEHVAPAVVHIEVDLEPTVYFGEFVTSPMKTNGSGFLIKETGLLLTNAHVVRNKRSVKIKLNDERRFTGTVLAVDMVADLAVVQIDAKNLNLPFLKLGDSDRIRAGEHCIAVGSPLSLSNTVTAGIVSNIGRTSSELGLFGRNINYIQTDCMITSGNSGGPLVNLDGEVIGINSMKAMTGISFSLPINYAKLFLADVEKKQSTSAVSKSKTGKSNSRRPTRYLGVKMFSLTPEIAEELRNRMFMALSINKGVFIANVVQNSEAQRAGIRPGDIIVQVNGQDIETSADLMKHVQEDEVLRLRVIRNNGLLLDITVTPESVE